MSLPRRLLRNSEGPVERSPVGDQDDWIQDECLRWAKWQGGYSTNDCPCAKVLRTRVEVSIATTIHTLSERPVQLDHLQLFPVVAGLGERSGEHVVVLTPLRFLFQYYAGGAVYVESRGWQFVRWWENVRPLHRLWSRLVFCDVDLVRSV